MALKPKSILRFLFRTFQILATLFGCYLAIIVGLVVWTFEVKLNKWPVFVYSAPGAIQVGDELEAVRLVERLTRCGYSKTESPKPDPGQWSQVGSDLNINLKYSPLKGHGIVNGPVSITLDWNKIKTIRLLPSREERQGINIEPELIGVISAEGSGPELCRPIPLDKIPALLIDAILVTEDTHFFSHQGIDLDSIVDAIKTNIKARRYVQGGSTISQQLMRMTILRPEKTLWRKINEVFLALAADAIYSKNTILQAYLNRVYLGHWGSLPVKGVEEASRNFFGKGLDQLDAADCAFLAAAIRAPNVINPFKHPERAKGRRDIILGLLLKAGKISREQYDEAISRPIKMLKNTAQPIRAAAFWDLIKEEAPKLAASQSGRHDVVTSLDPLLQADAESAWKRLDDANIPYYFLLINPYNGDLKAYSAPVANKWRGPATTLDAIAPMILLRAFVPDKNDRAQFTLTSQVISTGHSAGTLTVRQAFKKERPSLIDQIVNRLGPDKIVPVVQEFGFKALSTNPLQLEPVSPTDMAQGFGMLANLGKPVSIKTVLSEDTSPTQRQDDKKNISVKPGTVFLVNYLMKGNESAEIKNGNQEKVWMQPSQFSADDEEGAWIICYRNDLLGLLRVKAHDTKDMRFRKTMEKFFKPPEPGAATQPDLPDGVVFRKICIQSGLRANSICPHVILEPFIKGTQPEEWCSQRHETESKKSEMKR